LDQALIREPSNPLGVDLAEPADANEDDAGC